VLTHPVPISTAPTHSHIQCPSTLSLSQHCHQLSLASVSKSSAPLVLGPPICNCICNAVSSPSTLHRCHRRHRRRRRHPQIHTDPISAFLFENPAPSLGPLRNKHPQKQVDRRKELARPCRCSGDDPTRALPPRRRAVTQPSQLEAPPAGRLPATKCPVPPGVPRASCSCARARLDRSSWSRRRPYAAPMRLFCCEMSTSAFPPHWQGRGRRQRPLPASPCSASAPRVLRLPSRARALASTAGCPRTSFFSLLCTPVVLTCPWLPEPPSA
jgi:hypothetical protein